MKVLVDTRDAYRNITGLGRIVRNYIVHLQEFSAINATSRYTFLPSTTSTIPSLYNTKTTLQRMWNFGTAITWKQISLPLAVMRYRPDVIFHTDYVATIATSQPIVILACDTLFFDFPQFDPFRSTYYKMLAPYSARKARKIITISQYSRASIVQRYGVSEENVVVAYPGVSHVFWQPTSDADIKLLRSKYNLPDRFILFVGTVDDDRRNLTGLLRVFARVAAQIEHKLVIVGALGHTSRKIFSLVSAMGLNNAVQIVGFVPDEDLRVFYRSADMFLYLSLAEGFGMTPLEAMACGCPVICSKLTSLPEVVGDAGILVDPCQEEDVVEQTQRLLADSNLQSELRKRGPERAKTFSWKQAAECIHAALEEAAGRG
jgi:glycosyltransferase involved in cell wall biosynthesis